MRLAARERFIPRSKLARRGKLASENLKNGSHRELSQALGDYRLRLTWNRSWESCVGGRPHPLPVFHVKDVIRLELAAQFGAKMRKDVFLKDLTSL
jgi:hypothetical protein